MTNPTTNNNELLASFYHSDTHQVEMAARESATDAVHLMQQGKAIPQGWHNARGRFLEAVNYLPNGPWRVSR